MGYWNETCNISKLPIFEGEEIVVILLREFNKAKESSPRTAYPTDKYTPLGFPIYGEYNDYGSIKNISNYEKVLEYLNTLKITHKDEREEIEEEFSLENSEEKLEEFMDIVLNGNNYYLKNDCMYIGKDKIRGMMIKRSLYDRLLTFCENDETRERITKELEEHRPYLFSYYNKMDIESIWFNTNSQIHLTSGGDESWEIIPYLVYKYFKEGNKEDFDYLIDIIFFYNCLEDLRMGYFSITGGQSYSVYLHKELARYMLEECERIEKQFDDDEEDE